MNTKLLTGLIVSSLLFLSCGQKREVTYNKLSSVDKSYTVEIPSDVVQYECIGNFMSFENANSHLIIYIQHINEGSIEEYVRNKNITNNTFSYNLFQSSDTTLFYKITKGNNMWSAYDLYMLKRLDGNNYLIKVNSDVLGQSKMIEMIKHIYTSMKLNGLEEANATSSSEKEKAVPLEKTYSTELYSIKYPQRWQEQEHLDEITEVYIGYKPDNFGFTIVRFETDYSLTEVNAETNNNARQSGFIKILDEQPMEVDGVKCYRVVQEFSLQGQKVKHISYTFKKGDMLYNIKFGSVSTKTQERLASKIIESFRFK